MSLHLIIEHIFDDERKDLRNFQLNGFIPFEKNKEQICPCNGVSISVRTQFLWNYKLSSLV